MKEFVEGYIKANPSLDKNEILPKMMIEPKIAKILTEREDVVDILEVENDDVVNFENTIIILNLQP